MGAFKQVMWKLKPLDGDGMVFRFKHWRYMLIVMVIDTPVGTCRVMVKAMENLEDGSACVQIIYF